MSALFPHEHRILAGEARGDTWGRRQSVTRGSATSLCPEPHSGPYTAHTHLRTSSPFHCEVGGAWSLVVPLLAPFPSFLGPGSPRQETKALLLIIYSHPSQPLDSVFFLCQEKRFLSLKKFEESEGWQRRYSQGRGAARCPELSL